MATKKVQAKKPAVNKPAAKSAPAKAGRATQADDGGGKGGVDIVRQRQK